MAFIQWRKVMTQVHTYLSKKEHTSAKVILLVEDDAVNAACIAELISQETPYHVFVATTSLEAVNFARHIRPHLLIVDYRLPDMNGIHLYDHLHRLPAVEATPAILLSACLEDCLDAIETRHLLGFRKPFDLDDFLSTIEEVLSWSSEDSSYSLLADTLS
jgi:CheY-like chemotaxis protein